MKKSASSLSVIVLVLFLALMAACGDGQGSKTTFTPELPESLTVAVIGAGTVTSDVGGLACPGACSATYGIGTIVTLTATPTAGSVFRGWSGTADCDDGQVVLDTGKTCTATFMPELPEPLPESLPQTLTVAVVGEGSVTSDVGGLACPGVCSVAYAPGTGVTLTATPRAGSALQSWSGAADCSDGHVVLEAATTCTATFRLAEVPLLGEEFAAGDLAGWQVVDEGTNTASAWAVVGGALVEDSDIFSTPTGGSTDPAEVPKLGTYVWYEGGLGWTDYRVRVPLRSTDNDALGVIVRYQDPQHYYRFSWDQQRTYRRLVKQQGGVWTVLATEAVPYVTDQLYEIEVAVQGATVEVRVDGAVLFGGPVRDPTPLTQGSVGLYGWANAASVFEAVAVEALPAVHLTAPVHLALTTQTQLTLTATATHFPADWGVEFVVDGSTAALDYFPPYAQQVTGLALAEHVLAVYMVDGQGVRQPAYTDQVRVGVGDYYVAFGDSITAGNSIHDTVSADDISADGRNTGGNYPPIVNDLLSAARGYPHTVVNAGVGGEEALDGVRRLPSVLAAHPAVQGLLILFGTNDSSGSMPVPSGRGLDAGDTGYAGTYKDHMQQMLALIDPAGTGRLPVVAKVPIRFGDGQDTTPYTNPETHPKNLLLGDYNAVLDELQLANPLIAVLTGPPEQSANFFTYFRDIDRGPNGLPIEFDDNLHPNGVGMQSMARLWCEVLLGVPCS